MNSYLSPVSITFLIMGIFLLVVPPLGVALLVAAVVSQVKYRRRVAGVRNAHQQKAYDRRVKAFERQQQEKMAAFRSFR